MTTAYNNGPSAPNSLSNIGIDKPIPFDTFLDLPNINTISTAARRSSILWKALELSIIDYISEIPIPLPTQGDIVNRIINDLSAVPVIGSTVKNSQQVRNILNTALAPLPNNQPTLRNLLPNALKNYNNFRRDLADDLWERIVKKVPIYLLVTNLFHEGSFFEGDEFLRVITDLLARKGIKDFKDLKIPLALISTDIKNNKMIVYSSKNNPNMKVAEAVRRSMSIPIAFQPRQDTGNARGRFVDGGLCSNFPIWLFTEGGKKFWDADSTAPSRPKIGFVLDESMEPKPEWKVKSSTRYDVSGSPPSVDEIEVVAPVLVQKLLEAAKIDVHVDHRIKIETNDSIRHMGRLIRDLAMIGNINKESASRKEITKGLMAGMDYYHVKIPLLGYHWLDFDVNKHEGPLKAMWDRAWNATYDAIGGDTGITRAVTTGLRTPLPPKSKAKNPYR